MSTGPIKAEDAESIRGERDKIRGLLVEVCQGFEKHRIAISETGKSEARELQLRDVPGLVAWWEKERPLVERERKRKEAERRRADAQAELDRLDREERGA